MRVAGRWPSAYRSKIRRQLGHQASAASAPTCGPKSPSAELQDEADDKQRRAGCRGRDV